MTPDEVAPPPDDAIARAARDGLRHLAGSHALTSLDWEGVVSGARRVRQRQLAAAVAACAIVLATAGAAYAGADHYRARVSIAGRGSAPATTTTTTEPAATTSTAAPASTTIVSPATSPDVTLPSITAPVAATLPTTPESLQPQDGSWSVSTSADSARVTVGDEFVVRADLTNTGTKPQETAGYGSFAIACSWAAQSSTNPGPEELPIGQFPTGGVVLPGQTLTVSVTFRAEAAFVGTLQCGTGIVFHGDAPYANTFGGVAIEVVPAAAVTTTTSAAA